MAAVKRIVLFTFKDGISDDTIKGIFADIAGLQDKIPGVMDFCWGPYSSSDNLNQGYTHAFILTFQNEAARDGFGPHPEHQKVCDGLGDHVAGVLAFDFLA